VNVPVTIVITCFNQGTVLGEAVDSAFQQSAVVQQVIIVDDESSEAKTLQILDELQKKYGIGDSTANGPNDTSANFKPMLEIIHQSNSGPAAARNKGIRTADTPYVVVLDGDDRLRPQFVARTLAKLQHDTGVVAVSSWLQTFGVLDAVVKPTGGSIGDFLSRNCSPATCMIRREAFMQSGGYDESMRDGFEDWDMFLSLLESGGSHARIDVVAQPLIMYRTAPASSNITSMNHRLELMRYLIDKHNESYVNNVAQAVLGVETISLSRLERWEQAMRDEPHLEELSSTARDFMRHPSYGDGGMAAAVRIRSNV
jgi:glycosyltransferase involved in cell wall biosynthesis